MLHPWLDSSVMSHCRLFVVSWVMTAKPWVQETLIAPSLPASDFTWHDTHRPGHTHPQWGPRDWLISGQLSGAPWRRLGSPPGQVRDASMTKCLCSPTLNVHSCLPGTPVLFLTDAFAHGKNGNAWCVAWLKYRESDLGAVPQLVRSFY